MNIKNQLLIITAIITIFISYNYLQTMGKGFHSLDETDYALETFEITKDNKWSAFRDEGNGDFFIHPGEKRAARGIFTFKKNHTIIFDFSIQNEHYGGDIKFTIKKNNKINDKSIVTIKKTNRIILEVCNGDKVEIIADKHGETSNDHGNLIVSVQGTQFEIQNILIPFLWSILFIFLFGKNHSYIASNSYIIFLLILFAERLNFGILTLENIITYMLFLFSMTFIFTFIYQELIILKKFRIASIISYITAFLIYIIPLFFIIYALNFDTKVTKDILYAVFQSNSMESYEYISDFISIKYILLFIFITTLLGGLLYKQEKKETLKIEKSLLIFMIITFLSLSIMKFSQLQLPNFLINSFDKYYTELKLFKQVQEKRKAGEINFNASKKGVGETYVVVIGESLNKKHMGIYGYLRNTTPLLSKINQNKDLIVFDNVYSNHVHTVPVLSFALTEANQYNKKTYYESLSIIEILNKADIETYWLTNQTIYGSWDNMVSVLASLSDNLIALNTSIGAQLITQKYDGALIKKVQKVLAEKSNKNRVIFVHLYGSHQMYDSRYPKNIYSKYTDKLALSEFGTKAAKNKQINYYDNSIVYNDYVISSILKSLQKESGVNGFIYMPDHADDVIRKLAHTVDKFTYEMTQIPMIAWFSKGYKEKYTNRYNNLLNNANTLYSNDMFYDTLIGVFDIKTDKYDSKYDFTSKDYTLNPKDALILHGKKHYTDKSNYIYWQKKNTKYLIDTKKSSRIFPHRVNSIGKLHDIWNNGFRSFEVDVRFGDTNATIFQMGHNHGVMSLSLEEFLDTIDHLQIKRVRIDFKNLNKYNYKKALDRLQYLDKVFNIKNKFLIESGTTSEVFQAFNKNGWHTSYYLPTSQIIKLMKKDNKAEMQELAIKIAKQTKIQNLDAISFDHRLYPFVKQYLEPLISDKIVYHTWYAPSLNSINFKAHLLKNKLYLDNRVKTLLTPYKSQFEL